MSLRRRLLLYLLIVAPLVWAAALAVSLRAARHEVDELFDTEMIRLARQVQVAVALPLPAANAADPPGAANAGEADMRDLAIAVWDAQGRLAVADREGVFLPYRPQAAGFVDLRLGEDDWRVYYLQSFDGSRLVAAGQRVGEREELSFDLTLSQLLPWLAMLPFLLAAMAWAVRRALLPVERLSAELRRRGADELQAVAPDERVPAELRPLVDALNGLFRRTEALLAHERRFTADAAHELRTPLAVLRAQWDVLRRAAPGEEHRRAEAQLDRGLARLDRLVTQMLALSRLEAGAVIAHQPVDWAEVAGQAMSDCLPLAERRGVELACEGLDGGTAPLPLSGDAGLLAVLLRNLLDNALRYARPASTVWLRLRGDALEVENEGAVLAPEQRARLGERFFRPDGQDEVGSGLGLSIVQRIADLHGLAVSFAPGPGGGGLRVRVGRPAA